MGQNASRKYDVVEKDNKLFRFVERERPDVLLLQETKAHCDQIKPELRQAEGYVSYYSDCRARKGYSGVALHSREEPDEVLFDMGVEEFDIEGRMVAARYGDDIFVGVYFPNGGKGDDRVDYKLRYYDALFDFVSRYKGAKSRVVVSGDYNTAHEAIDLARPKENVNTTGFLPREREKLSEVMGRGYVDAFRLFEKEGGHYTWWSQRGQARRNNVGWRIDYHLVSEGARGDIKSCIHLPKEEGSDHCPVVMELA